MTRRSTRLAVGQFGAPTVVVNATLAGFVEEAASRRCHVFGIPGGPQGLLRGELGELYASEFARGALGSRPGGAALGSGRGLLRDEDLHCAIARLRARGIAGLALIGGNGTMILCQRIARAAEAQGVPLAVLGLPKTVDNDLCGTDHSPGFPSAARYLRSTVRELDADHLSMVSIEKVRILETLGRNAGWLALSTFLARRREQDAPHLVLVPEGEFDEAEFLRATEQLARGLGRAFIVVAEGCARHFGDPRFEHPVFDRPVTGGVARRLAALVQTELCLTARAESPGLLQRCSGSHVSKVDRAEAAAVGRYGAQLLSRGIGSVMVAIQADRSPGYCSRMQTVGLDEVAGRSRPAPGGPSALRREPPAGFRTWLRPLLGGSTQRVGVMIGTGRGRPVSVTRSGRSPAGT